MHFCKYIHEIAYYTGKKDQLNSYGTSYAKEKNLPYKPKENLLGNKALTMLSKENTYFFFADEKCLTGV